MKHLPLSSYPSFRADNVNCLAESVEDRLRAAIVKLPESPAHVEAKANRYSLPCSELWFCSYGLPITLRFSETEDLRIQFHRTGLGSTRVGKEVTAVTAGQSCISSAAGEVDFGSDFQQVAWRLPRSTLKQKLAALTGEPATRPLEFNAALDMATPQSAALRQILESVLLNIEYALPSSEKLVLPELESALVLSLLCTAHHNYRDLLDRATPGAAPWQVRRAESYIEANWNKPLNIEDLVSATGASVRSIFRTFKKSRGYSPFQFAKKTATATRARYAGLRRDQPQGRRSSDSVWVRKF